jgi:hypothetical protein
MRAAPAVLLFLASLTLQSSSAASPGILGEEFVVGSGPKPTLIVRDAQHEYVFASNGSRSSSR